MAMDSGDEVFLTTAAMKNLSEDSGNYEYEYDGHNTTGPGNVGANIQWPIISALTGVVGNVLALVILHRTRKDSKRLMFHGLVGGLVWNDLLGILLTTPVTVSSYLNGLKMPGGEHLCRFNGFAMICFGISTPLIVCAMAIERILFVKYTFFYTRHCPPSTARFVILAIWGFVLLFGLLPLFGFGEYVLQYPNTWCFMKFRKRSPEDVLEVVNAVYAYLYASINLLLSVVMIVCNLVVVATLVRVRDYRRKHSSSSLSMSLVVDAEDFSRVQMPSRRRTQKDIELQMICVLFAITSIFAVCWIPLMIHIIYTLAMGVSDGLLGLIGVRLASFNQAVNPWLYVILRRTLIVRVKKFCCRWRNERRRKAAHGGHHSGGRKHQYVRVGHRLCHRNNFVGVDANSQSLSDSMRKSLQKALPAAISLPDVMMVNTNRRELDLPLPDVAKAQSFAGRVSHGTCDYNNHDSRCCYCDCPSHSSECSQCTRDLHKDKMICPNSVRDHDDANDAQKNACDDSNHVLLKSKDAVQFSTILGYDSSVEETRKHGNSLKSNSNSKSSEDLIGTSQARTDVTERLRAKPPSGRKDPGQYRDFQSSIKNSSSSSRQRTDSQKSNDLDIITSILPPSNRSSLHSQTGSIKSKGAMTQYIHMQKRDTHGAAPAHNVLTATRSYPEDSNKLRKEVSAMPFSEDFTCDASESQYSGAALLPREFDENGTSSNSKNDNTTDCGMFSSNPTESVCFSETTCGASVLCDPRKPHSHPCFEPRHHEVFNECNHCPLTLVHQAHVEAYHKLGRQGRTRSKSYTNDGWDASTIDGLPEIDRPLSIEEDGSSGVFSVESPTRLQEAAEHKRALWESRNQHCIDGVSNSKSPVKQLVRRIKSVT